MRCPYCNEETPFEKKNCSNCGMDLGPYKKIISWSNIYYNDGLEKAQVRDLTGAIQSLEKSLSFNKYNTSARNLLGLVYYEERECVYAMTQWVISKNYQPEGNDDADYFLNKLQNNPGKLDTINYMVKKYNSSLEYAKNGDEDMAVIQLKKLVNTYPEYIRAGLLLSLLYIHSGKKEDQVRAARLLRNILKRDISNTTALRYMAALPDVRLKKAAEKVNITKKPPEEKKKEDPVVIKPYREEKPGALALIQVGVGILAGIIIMAFLIQPVIDRTSSSRSNKEFREYSKNISSNDSSTSSLSQENEKLKEDNKKLEDKVSELQGGNPTDIANYQKMYDNIIKAGNKLESGDKVGAANILIEVDRDDLESSTAKKAYDKIKDQTFSEASDEYFKQGRDCYNGDNDYAGKKDFDEAKKLLKKSLKFNKDNTDAMYFIGRCLQQKSKFEKAAKYYNQIIDDYPDSSRVTEARSRLREMGF